MTIVVQLDDYRTPALTAADRVEAFVEDLNLLAKEHGLCLFAGYEMLAVRDIATHQAIGEVEYQLFAQEEEGDEFGYKIWNADE